MTTARALDQSHTLAPWAEFVADSGPVRVDTLLTLADDGYRYEVVEGVLVRVAGSGKRATTIAVTLIAALSTFVRPRRLGVVTGADGVYKFPAPRRAFSPMSASTLPPRSGSIFAAGHASYGLSGLSGGRSTCGAVA